MPKESSQEDYYYREKRYELSHKKAKALHNEIINHPRSYSLTLTLNPRYNDLAMYEQFAQYIPTLTKLLRRLDRYFNVIMYTPEFTQDHNIHFHLYFTIPEDMPYELFDQTLKTKRTKQGLIGSNYKLKKIDDVTEELINYPFKDVDRTKKYASLQVNSATFTPFHGVIKGRNSWKII